jgi:hypothetical protein
VAEQRKRARDQDTEIDGDEQALAVNHVDGSAGGRLNGDGRKTAEGERA